MIDFSKRPGKKTRTIFGVIAILIVVAMIIGLLM